LIIGIAGVAGSGKTTAGDTLLARGYARGKFANSLKEMMRSLLRYRGCGDAFIERCLEGDLKETPLQELGGRSPRHAMQTLGAWARSDLEEDYWIDTEFDAQDGEGALFFDDLRHPNEEAAIVARGGVIIHVIGRGGIEGEHISETFKPANATVIVNDGSIEEFRAKIDRFASDLS
jgi:hypothetical protein